jgi:hypothetical protein
MTLKEQQSEITRGMTSLLFSKLAGSEITLCIQDSVPMIQLN